MQGYYVSICTACMYLRARDWYMALCTVPNTETGLCKFKAVQQKGKPEFQLQLIGTNNLQNEGNWTFASAWGRIKNLPLSSD